MFNKKVLLILAVGLAISFSVPAEALWLSGYEYRKEFTINGSPDGNLTDYQLLLNMYKGSGTDSGNSVYLSSVKDDFSDIRFTNSAGTELDYWIEEKTDGSSAVVWVECDSLPQSASTDFYMYYGNNDAVSASNGSDTFRFFDDCSGTFSDNWTEDEDYGNADFYNGTLRTEVEALAGDKYGLALANDYTTFTNNWLHLHWEEVGKSGWAGTKRTCGGFIKEGSGWIMKRTADPDDGIRILWSNPTTMYLDIFSGGIQYSKGSLTVGANDNTVDFFFNTVTGEYKVVVDGVTEWSGTDAGATSGGSDYNIFFEDYGFVDESFHDEIFSRTYTDSEPLWSMWGNEQQQQLIPEPASLLLLGFGVTGLAIFKKINLFRFKRKPYSTNVGYGGGELKWTKKIF